MLHSLFIVELHEQQLDATDFTYQFVSLCSSMDSAIRLCRSYDPRSEASRYWFAILETTVDPPVPEIATRLVICISKAGTLMIPRQLDTQIG